MIGYYLVLTYVTKVDLPNNYIQIRPYPNDVVVTDITIELSDNPYVLYLKPYGSEPRNGMVDDKNQYFSFSKDMLNYPTGMMFLPSEGDHILVAVHVRRQGSQQHYDITPFDVKELIILGHIARFKNSLDRHDNIIMDRSGAKIHFNHGWLDSTNILEVKGEEGSDVPPEYIFQPTGHLTIAGNRLVVLSGRKFLPFGMYSHLLQKGLKAGVKTNDPKVVHPLGIANEVGDIKWSEIFSRDVSDMTKVFNQVLFGKNQGQKPDIKFLEPPCPTPDEDMKMHDSGWKRTIHANASEEQFVRSCLSLVGEEFKGLAFAPEAKQASGKVITQVNTDFLNNDPTILTEEFPDTAVVTYYRLGDLYSVERKNYHGLGLCGKVITGSSEFIVDPLPATIILAKSTYLDKSTKKAEPLKKKVFVGEKVSVVIDGTIGAEKVEVTVDTVTVTIDAVTKKVTIDASEGLVFTGDLTVTGKITATGDITGPTVIADMVKSPIWDAN